MPGLVVAHPYWTFWEHTAPADFRAGRESLAARVADLLGDLGSPVRAALLDTPAAGRELAARLAGDPPDAVVVLQTMAAPPTHALGLLDELPPTVPVVMWALQERGALEPGFDHHGITTRGATVGAPMLGNVLSRRGRAFDVVLAPLDDPAGVGRARERVLAAVVAGGFRRGRLGRVGDPLQGYAHVDADDAALSAATGLDVVRIPTAEVRDRYAGVPAERVDALRGELASAWDVDRSLDGDALDRSLRVAAALADLVADHRLDAGAINCHVGEIRFGEEIGVTPCYGLGRLTSAGVPWTCTGDVLTAVAMLAAKRLGGAALYHEIEAVDHVTGEVALANSGEHDTAWLTPGERPRLVPNGWFCGSDARCGACALFSLRPGPATLLGFTPHPDSPGGFRFVAAPGTVTNRRFPATGTVNGAFRFAAGAVEHTWPRWVAAGVNHHSAAAPGHLAAAVTALAKHLGLGAVIV